MIFNEQLYDELYEKADNLVKLHNPCQVKDRKCLRKQCGGRNFCCAGCNYLTKNGCSAEKPLSCRTWFCYQVDERMKSEISYQFAMIRKEIKKNKWYIYRTSKNDIKRVVEREEYHEYR